MGWPPRTKLPVTSLLRLGNKHHHHVKTTRVGVPNQTGETLPTARVASVFVQAPSGSAQPQRTADGPDCAAHKFTQEQVSSDVSAG